STLETHPPSPFARGKTHPLSLDPPASSSPGLPIHSQRSPVRSRWSHPLYSREAPAHPRQGHPSTGWLTRFPLARVTCAKEGHPAAGSSVERPRTCPHEARTLRPHDTSTTACAFCPRHAEHGRPARGEPMPPSLVAADLSLAPSE